jgi:glycosyltransferase involved in cell wall biosynthesis
MKIVIVVPVYNEEKYLVSFLKDLTKTGFEIVVVDDGSTDSSYEIIQKFKVHSLRHEVNLGKGSSMKTGAEAAFNLGADAIIFMDADGQHKVEDLPEFIEKIKEGNEVVLGSRNLGLEVPLIRFLGNKFASVLINVLFSIYVSDLLCGFRAITKKAYKKMNLESQGYGVETEMVIKVKQYKLKYCEVPVATVYYDKIKGVTILDAFSILLNVIFWRFRK